MSIVICIEPGPEPLAVPGQFSIGSWAVTDLGSSGEVLLTISTLPIDNDSPITDVEYRVNTGTWTPLTGILVRDHTLGGFPNGVPVVLSIRAKSIAGAGDPSDIIIVTPTSDLLTPVWIIEGSNIIQSPNPPNAANYSIAGTTIETTLPPAAVNFIFGPVISEVFDVWVVTFGAARIDISTTPLASTPIATFGAELITVTG